MWLFINNLGVNFTSMLDFLGQHQGAITVIATIVIALSAVITILLTRSLVKENRLLRKVGEEPKVIAYLAGDPRHWYDINFILANVGRGPARNIEFQIDLEEKYFGHNRVAPMNNPDRKSFDFLPQDEEICMLLGSGPQLIQQMRLPPFKVNVQWENLKGTTYSDEYELDVSQFLGIFFSGRPADHEIAETLAKIDKHLEKLASAVNSRRAES